VLVKLGLALCFFLYTFLRICAITQEKMHRCRQVIMFVFLVYVMVFFLEHLEENVCSKYVVVLICIHSGKSLAHLEQFLNNCSSSVSGSIN